MTDKVIENNQVTVMGEIVSDFTFSHEIFGEGFYMVDTRIARLSDSTDIIPDVLVKVFLFKKSISGMTNKPPMRKSFILCNCRS